MSSNRSTVAAHALRGDIEKCLKEGTSAREVARTYGLSASAVTRYWRSLRKREQERLERLAEMTDLDRLVERLNTYANIMEGMAKAEHGSGKYASAGKLIDTGRKILRDVAELKGMLKPGIQIGVSVNSTTNVSASRQDGPAPEQVKAAIFKVLRHYPEARDALATEFQRLQIEHDGGAAGVEVISAEPVEAEVTPAPRARRCARG